MKTVHADNMHKAPVVIMAGGTGGHIFPGLAVAEVLISKGIPVAWVGARGGMEERLVDEHGIDLHVIKISGVRGKSMLKRLQAPWRLLLALVHAIKILRQIKPQSVLSMGGYVAGPGGIAAWLLRIPLVVHEQNSVAGMTNSWLVKVATHVLTGFQQVFPGNSKAVWVGNPVRADIAALEDAGDRIERHHGALRILVVGGSLGAHSLNTYIPEALAALKHDAEFEVYHQCGQRDQAMVTEAYAQFDIEAKVAAFIEHMADAYAWADVIVCRAGALTVAEICAAGLAAILVPFPYAVDDHQTGNAKQLVDAGAALLVQERNFADGALARALQDMLQSRANLLHKALAARTLAKPQAAQCIADYCLGGSHVSK